ncbi:hypothetical protein GLOTRDRAFT_137916 [Gloeophyllum trabeum ATCC 11539]|uniref:Uncharacterized protein n=1 Tax=Gloeophyllum trabeum (strain ATCC 11539 / FP-39264 / Madison 617) TaxID=670483 RepID=S7QE11_GLOTA|nr:uncharacterized protein GLOTRDRAFT_137916 [Gloeophyllum trabeum ATCC 11539]EPQ57657.1 hypothetical protein GLOTRDRAFT_137916 [Gloeophyllum trabeum ATCC 11539]
MQATVLRSQVLRAAARPTAARAVPRARRTYAAGPGGEAAPQPGAPKGGSNTPLLVGLLAVGAGGAYYYYYATAGETAGARRKADQEALKGHVNGAVDAGKATAQDALQEGQQKYGELKGTGADKLQAERARAERAAADAEAKLEQYKAQAKGAYSSTVASAQEKYDHARASASSTLSDAERKLEEAKAATEKQASSWWSWLTFGLFGGNQASGKEEGADKVKQESASLSETQRKV